MITVRSQWSKKGWGGAEGFCYTSFTEMYSKTLDIHVHSSRVRAKTLDYLSPVFSLLCSLYCLYQEILVLIIAKQCSKFSKLGLELHVNQELPDFQAGFRKGAENQKSIANIRWIIKSKRIPQQYLLLLHLLR